MDKTRVSFNLKQQKTEIDENIGKIFRNITSSEVKSYEKVFPGVNDTGEHLLIDENNNLYFIVYCPNNSTIEVKAKIDIFEFNDDCMIQIEVDQSKIFYLKIVLFFMAIMAMFFCIISDDRMVTFIMFTGVFICYWGIIQLTKRRYEKKFLNLIKEKLCE